MRKQSLLAYLHQNKTLDPIGSGNSAHDHFVRRIAEEPHLLGIRGDFQVFREVRLINGSWSEMGRVDVAIYSESDLTLVECRSFSNREKSKVYRVQGLIRGRLRAYYQFFNEEFGIASTCIGVYRFNDGGNKFTKLDVPAPIDDLLGISS